MVSSYFLDTGILYAYLNETDKHNNKVRSYLDKLMLEGKSLVISQYVLYEFVLLSLRRAADDYFEENDDITEIPDFEINKIMEHIEEQKDLLTILDIKVYETPIPANDSLLIEEIIEKLTIKKIANNEFSYAKIMGLIDHIHLVCCKINKCQFFLTIDNDFNNSNIKSLFKDQFQIIIIK